MAFDTHLADRISNFLKASNKDFYEKKMFGGLCFMVNNKMCVGIVNNELMARIHPDEYEKALQKEGCSEMNFTGRPMKGFVFLSPDATDLDSDLEYWLKLALAFNPSAKSSKK